MNVLKAKVKVFNHRHGNKVGIGTMVSYDRTWRNKHNDPQWKLKVGREREKESERKRRRKRMWGTRGTRKQQADCRCRLQPVHLCSCALRGLAFAPLGRTLIISHMSYDAVDDAASVCGPVSFMISSNPWGIGYWILGMLERLDHVYRLPFTIHTKS